MAEREDSRPQLAGLLGPGLVVALASLVAYFSFEPRLQSQRPDLAKPLSVPAPPSPPRLSALHARLWDDPLAVAYEHSERREGSTGKRAESINAALHNVLSGESTEPDIHSYFQSLVENMRNARGSGNDRFLCLGVLVPGEPYDADAEERKRITYAVVSALANAGYELSYPDRLSYVALPVWIDVRAVSRAVPRNLVVPVKLFRPNRVRPLSEGATPKFAGVQVCWINEDQLGDRPLAVIGQVLEGMYGTVKGKEQFAVRILGPASSDTLVQMAEENANWAKKSWKSADPPAEGAYAEATGPEYFKRWHEPTLVSGRATISVQALSRGQKQKKSRLAIDTLAGFVGGEPTSCGLTVRRSIGDDAQLAALLAGELHLRGAWPPRGDPARDYGRGIVLVTERDSSYGSLFAATLENALAKLVPPQRAAILRQEILHEFTYLRGLDGKIPGDKSDSDESPGGKSKPDESQLDPLRAQNPESIPASGRSQFDYLRRLERELVDLDRTSREQGQDGIIAIGVIGTDIYDKLLILRALRKRFPRTWFFSTDVDAQLSQPGEYPTSRNLLVASHFGLALHPDLQRTAPPFRNSYQTSTYFSCLLALEDEGTGKALQSKNESDPWGLRKTTDASETLRPLMFEIGRSGPYQLTMPATEGASERVHPAGPRKELWLAQNWWSLLAALLLFALGWFFVHTPRRGVADQPGTNPTRRGATLLLTVLLLTLYGLVVRMAVHDHTRPGGEPLVFFEGISIWPPILVRLAGVVLSILFLVRAMRRLSGQLGETLQVMSAPAVEGAGSLSSWRDRVVRAFRVEWKMLLSRLSHPAGPHDGPEDASCFYHRLQRSGLQRLAVCMAQAVPFLLFVLLMFRLTEAPASPFRGPVTQALADRVQHTSTFFFLVLTFFVISALKVGRLFVERVGDGTTAWNPATISHLQSSRGALCASDVVELQTIESTAELTETVGTLVKYPFIILFVNIVSRHPAFDKLDLSWSLAFLWILVAAALLSSAYHLRTGAAATRDQVVRRLSAGLSAALAASSEARAGQLRQFISEIEQERRGAFGPLTQDPLMHALALGGSSGLLLVQQVLPYV